VEIIHGLLSMCGCCEDGPLVVLQDGQPISDVCRVILADFGRDAKIGAKESAGKLGNQLLLGVAFIAP